MRTASFASLFTALTFAASPVTAQQADVTLIGTACTTPDGTPNMTVAGLPQLGTTMTFHYAGPNFLFSSGQTIAQPLFVLGFALVGPVVIPSGLFFMQPSGCEIWTSSEVVIPMEPVGPSSSQYVTSQNLPISTDPAIVGLAFFAQWWATNTQCGFAGCNALNYVATSEAAICTVGL